MNSDQQTDASEEESQKGRKLPVGEKVRGKWFLKIGKGGRRGRHGRRGLIFGRVTGGVERFPRTTRRHKLKCARHSRSVAG